MQAGEGGALLSEQLSECLCVCSRLALFVSQRQMEECSKEITWLINMILAAVQQSARLQKDLGVALKYKTNAKQMMEEMRTVIEQQRAIIRASYEKSQLSNIIPTADQSTNTDDSFDRMAEENQQLKHAVNELRALTTKQSTELHDVKVAREAQEKVLKMMYQEHQSTLAKCAKLENSLKTMKTAVQQVLYPRDTRVDGLKPMYERDSMLDRRPHDKSSRRPSSRGISRHDSRGCEDPEEEDVDEQDEVIGERSRGVRAQTAELSESESTGIEIAGRVQLAQAASQMLTKKRTTVLDNVQAMTLQRSLFPGTAQSLQHAPQKPVVMSAQEQNKADPVHRYAAVDLEGDEDEDDEDEDDEGTADVNEASGSDPDQASDGDYDEDGDRIGELSSDEGSAADHTSSQEHDSLDELDGSDCAEDELNVELQEHQVELLDRSLESSVAAGESDGHSDPSTSQDRPDDSISQMQRFYSSLLIDDVLP